MDDSQCRVYIVRLPGDVHGAVRIDADGFASIYINDRLSPKAKEAVLKHELRHIYRRDHTNDKTIKEVES